MMDVSSIDPKIVAFLCVAFSILLLLLQLGIFSSNGNNKNQRGSNIPDAQGGAPLIGNALQYKEDPTGCIRQQEKLTDSKVFRINLAGRKMIVVGSCPFTMKHIATQPESVMSSCRAVAEIGFEYTLGHLNVYKGTAWHKAILKNYTTGDKFHTVFLPGIFRALSKAMDKEQQELIQIMATNSTKEENNGEVKGPDLFPFIRRCVLRATLDEFVGPQLLQKDPELLSALMVFQDRIEDTTAKAAVLPKFIALPAFYWPCERARIVLQKRLASLLQLIWKDANSNTTTKNKDDDRLLMLGPWSKTYLQEGTAPEMAAEHLIGLVFAAHKNPSIGAAQCFCFLRSELNEEQQAQATKEAKQLCNVLSKGDGNLTDSLLEAKILRTCVLETMRLTAHTLGAVRYAEQPITLPSSASTKQKEPLHVAQGETIALAHHTMHMESSIWGDDPEKFALDRPEWQETTKQDRGIPVDHYKLTTFSNGIHKCPGEHVALAMMEMVLALLLTKDTHLVGKLPPLSFERATLAQRDGPVGFRLSNKQSL